MLGLLGQNMSITRIIPHKDKSCLTMLEEVICIFMTQFVEKRNEVDIWTSNIPPRLKKELDNAYEPGNKINVMASSDLHFRV